MMRSLYSAVSGLKTHQTKMDVIGNNIANVNTEAFKASSVRFSEIMYQTTSSASSGNGAAGTGGKNAKQIGLGVTTGSTTVSITASGSAETTGNPFDLKLTDKNSTNFFVVSDGTSTLSSGAKELKSGIDTLNSNSSLKDDFRAGKTRVQGFIMGQIMKQLKGKVNPSVANKIILEELNK